MILYAQFLHGDKLNYHTSGWLFFVGGNSVKQENKSSFTVFCLVSCRIVNVVFLLNSIGLKGVNQLPIAIFVGLNSR